MEWLWAEKEDRFKGVKVPSSIMFTPGNLGFKKAHNIFFIHAAWVGFAKYHLKHAFYLILKTSKSDLNFNPYSYSIMIPSRLQ
jgi:hypothetical protein